MAEAIAYLSGQWVPASGLALPVYDAGFVLGATVTEQLRTFGGDLFCLEEHLERLVHSLQIVGIDPGLPVDALADAARRLVSHNHPLQPAGADLGLCIFVTPGPYTPLSGGAAGGPTVCMHSYPLQFHLWAHKYNDGESVVISEVEQVSPRSWPPALKCRSRMHYFLADRQAATASPPARAVLLNQQGLVSEATTANVVLYRQQEGLVSPPREQILPGISLMVLSQLAEAAALPLVERDVRPQELAEADEVLLTSTSVCVLPVVRCGAEPIGPGKAGPVFRQLLAAWSQRVGLDIAEQARRFASQAVGNRP